MKRNIISIDDEKCNGCGLCVINCEEGALKIIDGKAKLVSDSYCDGLGNCLPACPVDAIKIIEREADEFDEELVKMHMEKQNISGSEEESKMPCGCPSTLSKQLKRTTATNVQQSNAANNTSTVIQSELMQWPVQMKLVNPQAPFLQNADLLIAADCTAFAYADIHKRFMKNKVTLIGCPKLDTGDYADKLYEILTSNAINSITVLRMEVPCCGGIVDAAKRAIEKSGQFISFTSVIISTDGQLKNGF